MALNIAITNDQTGVTATFWIIGAFNVDVLNKRINVTLFGFVSSEVYARPGSVPVDQRVFQFDQAAFVEIASASPDGETVLDVIANALYPRVTASPRINQYGQQLEPEFAAAEYV